MPEHTPFYAFQTYVNSGVPRFLSPKHNDNVDKKSQKGAISPFIIILHPHYRIAKEPFSYPQTGFSA